MILFLFLSEAQVISVNARLLSNLQPELIHGIRIMTLLKGNSLKFVLSNVYGGIHVRHFIFPVISLNALTDWTHVALLIIFSLHDYLRYCWVVLILQMKLSVTVLLSTLNLLVFSFVVRYLLRNRIRTFTSKNLRPFKAFSPCIFFQLLILKRLG